MDKKIITMKTKRNIFIILMLLFPLLQFSIFTVYTNLSTIVMGFQSFDYETNQVYFAGFENLRRFIIEYRTTTMWRTAIVNSFWYFPLTVGITLPLTVIFAYFLKNGVKFAGFFKVVFYIPNIVSIVVMALVFKSLFHYNGPVNTILVNVFNVSKNDIPIWFNEAGVTMKVLYFYAIWAGIGGNIIIMFGAMARVPKELCEAGALDGVGTWRELFQIYLPIIWPTVSTLIVFGVASMFSMFLHTQVLTDGAGESWTVASILMTKVKENNNPYYAAMISLIITIFAVPVTQFVKWAVGKVWADVQV